ncbi:MAG: molybdopterin-guanine dinucleotide biosynthesis protein B [Alphaproteobacteria bacterium]|nr:molybdopterin-guanine dinucleotide biosynthesis protein B [Alphaproteobacteria bacterium]
MDKDSSGQGNDPCKAYRPTVFGIIGWKNCGKTTLIERLIREFTARGLSVSTIKHAHHAFDIDIPGKDSYRHREAGAHQVLIASSERWALMHELRGVPQPSLSDLVAYLAPCDLVLVEGFKSDAHPKLEVLRPLGDEGRIADKDETVCAIATDDPALAGRHPHLPLSDTTAIADFICQRCDLVRAPSDI